jgi:hypothetical protein
MFHYNEHLSNSLFTPIPVPCVGRCSEQDRIPKRHFSLVLSQSPGYGSVSGNFQATLGEAPRQQRFVKQWPGMQNWVIIPSVSRESQGHVFCSTIMNPISGRHGTQSVLLDRSFK